MYPYEFSLSFRITHPSQDLSKVYAMLGSIPEFTPGRIWKVGDRRKTRKGNELKGHYPNSYCYLEIKNKMQSVDKSLSSAIEDALNQLRQYNSALQEIVTTGGELSFFIGWFIGINSGHKFDYPLLRSLADRNIALDFDVYSESTSPYR